MRASLANARSPVITSVIREQNVRDAIAAIKNSEYAGAQAFDLHLSCLETKYQNAHSLEAIIRSTEKPILVLNYNTDYSYVYHETTEDDRLALLTRAAEVGASAVDLQAYSYELSSKDSFDLRFATDEMAFVSELPKEVALTPETIRRQKTFIRNMHDLGVEVLMSCHPAVFLNCGQVISLARELASRGPDIVKIIIPLNTPQQLAENFKTIITLKQEITNCKIHFHGTGAYGKVTRFMNPMLGAHMAFCVERYTQSSNFEQIHLKTFADAINSLDWREKS